MATTPITKTLTTTLSLRPSLKRLFSTVPTITRSPTLRPIRSARPTLLISNSTRSLAPFSAIRCRVNWSGPYSTLNNNNSGGSNFSDRSPTEFAPTFPGCDYAHWVIVMDKTGDEDASKQQMIDAYIQTLSKVVGREEAIKKIYKVSCEGYFGFGCEVDEETAKKMEGLPGVFCVLPDSYADPEYNDYGADLFVNGEIVQRSPERQRRVKPLARSHGFFGASRSHGDRPRYGDTSRYKMRENMR
ncbi:multiple organellar RNA editing factor 2, chloroplastic-like isoform X2 [Silene latifolia]|uniref:multiple organellar RNA editing factor 2, chloroplastic-like isoform X2 n=1 Tax=Silene latifolia TaxID=37657 RepID=UPI003D786557